MANSVRVVVKIIARAEAVDAMKAVVLKLAERSHAENGCISYEALQDQSAPERFVLVEEWSSAEALDAHNRTPHFHEAVAAAGPLLAAPLEVGRYTAIG
jgi:quinol monooxygenase YgiN